MTLDSFDPMAWRKGVRIKAKRAPASISTAKEALEAFRRFCRYDEMASYARTQGGRSAGTYTSRNHYARAEEYAEVAQAWRDLTEGWLKKQAGE
jgi:hypothetical protein